MKACERWSVHIRRLSPLVSDYVRIQNQFGSHPTKWDKPSTVIEVRQFDQYAIRTDGFGRNSLHNRKVLMKYSRTAMSSPTYSITGDLNYVQTLNANYQATDP